MNLLILIKRGILDIYDKLWVLKHERIEYRKQSSSQYKHIKASHPLSDEQKKSIDVYFKSTYGRKIPYDWHQFYTAHNGVFKPDYFPEFLYRPHFEHYMNYRNDYAEVMEDKNFLPNIVTAAGVAMPEVLVSRTMKLLRDGHGKVIDEEKAISILLNEIKVFCKPSTISYGGRGCFVFEPTDKHSIKDLLSQLGPDFVIQKLLKCHQSISSIYPNAVNTFRVTTYRWKDKFYCMPIAIRLGRGGQCVDNATSGGMFIGIQNDGTLNKEAMDIAGNRYSAHPDTGVVFESHRIEGVEDVIATAIRLHAQVPQLGVIGWDFTVDQEGVPVVIEANVRNASYRLSQMAHGVSPFLERTPEVLKWIKKMKHIPYSKRSEYAFGE